MTDQWRYRCPRGHVHLRRRRSPDGGDPPYWYCRTCQRRYAQVRDLKTGVEVTA